MQRHANAKPPEIEILLPPENNDCPVCAARHQSRPRLDKHVQEVHQCRVRWVCRDCGTYSSLTSRSVTTHRATCPQRRTERYQRENLDSASQDEPLPTGSASGPDTTALPDTIQMSNAIKHPPQATPLFIVLDYPPIDALRCVCDQVLSSRENLEKHYMCAHDCQVHWKCRHCKEKILLGYKSASGHYTKCRKKEPSQPSNPTQSHGQGPKPSCEGLPHDPDQGQTSQNPLTMEAPSTILDPGTKDLSIQNHPDPHQDATSNMEEVQPPEEDNPPTTMVTPSSSPPRTFVEDDPRITSDPDTTKPCPLTPLSPPEAAPLSTDSPDHDTDNPVSPYGSISDTSDFSPPTRRGPQKPSTGLACPKSPTESEGPPIANRHRVGEQHARWTTDELWILARLQLKHGGRDFINTAIASELPHRTLGAIRQARHTERFKIILEQAELEESILNPPPAAPLPTSSTMTHGSPMSVEECAEILQYHNIDDPTLAANLVSAPINDTDIDNIYRHFHATKKTGRELGMPKSRERQTQNGSATIRPGDGNPAQPSPSQMPKNRNRKERKRDEFRQQQAWYKKGPKVFMQEMQHHGIGDGIPLEAIHRHFDPVFSVPATEPRELPEATKTLPDGWSLFTDRQVSLALKHMNIHSAAGPDGMTLKEMLKIPVPILTLVLNNILFFAHAPESMRESRTVFIPKKSKPLSPTDLRPITLSSFLARLFSKTLLGALSNGRCFHPYQNGFGEDRAAPSNLITLQALMIHAKKSQSGLYVASLDLRKAFDSVGHTLLLQALAAKGASKHIVELVGDLLSNCSTTFRYGDLEDGRRVPLRCGVKQGDPISPFLFNCVIDPLLDILNSNHLGYKLNSGNIGALAYADDIVIISGSHAGLQEQVKSAENFFHAVGLQLNPTKTQYFGWRFCSKNKSFKYDISDIIVSHASIKATPRGSPVTYLGLGVLPDRAPLCSPEQFTESIDIIKNSRLRPSQKVHCLNTLVLPAQLYVLSCSLNVLQTSRTADKFYGQWVKAVLHLPHSFPTFLIHRPHKRGGLGLLSLTKVAPEVQLKAFARLRRLGDNCTDELLDGVLQKYVTSISKALGTPPSITDIHQLQAALKTSRTNREEAAKNNYSNKSLFSHDSNNLGNHWLRPNCGYVKEGDKIKALRLRSNLWPTRTLSNRHTEDPSARLCRRCGKEPETAYHILQICPAVHDSRVKRHDFIKEQTERIIRKACPTARITVEKTTTAEDRTRLRPDIVVELQDRVLNTITPLDTFKKLIFIFHRRTNPAEAADQFDSDLKFLSSFHLFLSSLLYMPCMRSF